MEKDRRGSVEIPPEWLTYPRLIGVHVADGAPLGDIYLELPPGLTVLYGRNGAGKSRLLQAIATALEDEKTSEVGLTREVLFEWKPDSIPQDRFDDAMGARADWFALRGNPWSRRRQSQESNAYSARQRDPFERMASAPTADQIQDLISEEISSLPAASISAKRMVESIVFSALPESVQGELGLRWLVRASLEVVTQGVFSSWVVANRRGRTVHGAITNEMPHLFAQLLLLSLLESDAIREIVADADGDLDVSDLVKAFSAAILTADGDSDDATGDPAGEQGAESGAWGEDDWFLHAMDSGLGTLLGDVSHTAFLEPVGDTSRPWWWHDPLISVMDEDPAAPFEVLREVSPDRLGAMTAMAAGRRLQAATLQDPSQVRSEYAEAGEELGRWLVENDGWYQLDPRLYAIVDDLTESANRQFGDLLERAPMLTLEVLSPPDWCGPHPFRWSAVDSSGALVPLDMLSSAQSRWASFAIQIALVEESPLPKVILLDEPEAALHRRAERHLVAGLERLAAGTGATIVTATHSPAFFSPADARLVHVHRGSDGRTVAEPMDRDFRSRIVELGIDTSDLLQFCKVALLVEGEHELAVFSELFGDVLAANGVELMALRGASNLKNASDAQLLFRFTDARLCVVLDNDRSARIVDIWDRARAIDDAGGDVIPVLKEFTAGGWSAEAKFLSEFCSLALRLDARDRITIRAMSLPDIVDYLPVNAIAPRAAVRHSTWAELRRIHAESGTRLDFKAWMTATFNASYDQGSLRSAVRQLDHIPTDFSDLVNVLLED